MKKAEPKRTNVQVLRGIRDGLNRKFAGMSAEELLAYFATRRPAKAKANGRKAAGRTRVTRVRPKVKA
ncbi:MAG: hypothetical protein IPG69_17705 [Flavobacteriales bacterium]|nr:hypothetical protein [Flavobacteriales bacterium]MBK9075201.1 hypothetical protein [Flavobacteriales bacterium]